MPPGKDQAYCEIVPKQFRIVEEGETDWPVQIVDSAPTDICGLVLTTIVSGVLVNCPHLFVIDKVTIYVP